MSGSGWRSPRCKASPGRASPRPRPASSTSATSRTPCSCGARRARRARPCCCGSRITIGPVAGPSTTPACSRTWPGSGSSPTRARSASRDDDAPYAAALDRLRGDGLVYGCDCSRTTFEAWADEHGRRWHGVGCPGGCRERGLDGPTLRVDARRRERALDGRDRRTVRRRGRDRRRPADPRPGRELDVRLLSVVVDDLRQGVDLVIRGRDLLAATPDQIRLGAAPRSRDRRRPSPTTRSSGMPMAGSCRRPTATRRSGTCARPAARPPPSSVRRPPRSG